ncbi:hypothetical protein [Mycobacterium sp. MMS18-G62]
MGNECLSESLKVLDELGYRVVYASYDENPFQAGWHPPLNPGEYYIETWMPDWAGYSQEHVIHVEVDPARPLPEGLLLR